MVLYDKSMDVLQSQRIGYTATPLPNIFIDPDSGMNCKDDLFPRHFIVGLEPPQNYVGPQRLFTERRSKNSIYIFTTMKITYHKNMTNF